jgi:hypothetical protein
MENELSYENQLVLLKEEIERLKALQPVPKHVCENLDCNVVTEKTFCKKHKPTCLQPGCNRVCYKDKCCRHSDTAVAYNREKARQYRARVKQRKTKNNLILN